MGVDKIVRIVAVVVALIAGLTNNFGWEHTPALIAVLGVIGGWFIEEDHTQRFLVAALALALVHGALGPIPGIGDYISGALASLSSLYNAAAVTVILVALFNRLKP